MGLPDLIIRHRSWREHELMGIEVKGEGTVVSLEQSLLSQEGAYPICYSLDDVVRELKRREANGGSPTQESTLKSLDNILTR